MRLLATIGALAIVFGIGCAVFFFGGYYSVAGTAEDPAAVTWALTKVRYASVNRHATHSPPLRNEKLRCRRSISRVISSAEACNSINANIHNLPCR